MRGERVQLAVLDLAARCVQRAKVLATAALFASPLFGQLEMAWRGHVIDPVPCRGHEAQTYAIYLPSTYTPERTWPIVYCFDPAARGRVPVERFRAAAEAHGYIIVGSNNSRNGEWNPIVDAAEAMLDDTQARFSLDHQRFYAAGFSGGARVACAVAGTAKFAGVVACGGGFPGSQVPADVRFAFFGTVGRTDFNFAELHRLNAELDRRKTPHQIVVFEGGHDWAPEPLLENALAWFDLQAMRAGQVARNEAWIREQFGLRLAAANAMAVPVDEQSAAYRAIVADFSGLLDTSVAVARLSDIEKSREYRRAVAARERAFRDETTWAEELMTALRNPDANGEAGSPELFREPPRPAITPPESFGDQNPDAERRSASSWARNRLTPDLQDRRDPFASLRRVADGLRRRSAKNPAAARALGGVFISCWSDGTMLLEQQKYAAAARALEAATILRPDAAQCYFEWARAAVALGDTSRARELLDTATAKGFAEREQVQHLRDALEPAAPKVSVSPAVAAASAERHVGPPTQAAPSQTAPSAKEERVAGESAMDHGSVLASTGPQETASPPTAPAAPTVPKALPSAVDTVQLEAVRVSGHAIGCFGISLKISALPDTRQICRIVIYDVVPESDAMAQGVQAGDEIVRVDGRSIFSFTAAFDRRSDFGRLFVGRERGDRIALELVTPAGTHRRVTLTEGQGDTRPPWLRRD